jgi:hydrogenase expression/formation protein HypE
MLEAGEVHVLRDPTRGGLATTLNEIAKQSNVVIELQDQQIPVKPQVRAACEMLGFDPLYVANEGKLIAFVKADDAEKILSAMKQNPYGKDAVVIGKVIDQGKSQVRLKTAIGGTRLVDMLPGEMLPRIC